MVQEAVSEFVLVTGEGHYREEEMEKRIMRSRGIVLILNECEILDKLTRHDRGKFIIIEDNVDLCGRHLLKGITKSFLKEGTSVKVLCCSSVHRNEWKNEDILGGSLQVCNHYSDPGGWNSNTTPETAEILTNTVREVKSLQNVILVVDSLSTLLLRSSVEKLYRALCTILTSEENNGCSAASIKKNIYRLNISPKSLGFVRSDKPEKQVMFFRFITPDSSEKGLRNFSWSFQFQVLALLHSDVHSEETRSLLSSLATCTLTVLPACNGNPVVSCVSHHPRGKILNQVVQYQINENFELRFVCDILETRNVQHVVKQPDPAANLTFNLRLKDSEKEVRNKLQLPYMKTSPDLPEILNEDDFYDEEDPDDDLDI